MPPKPRARISVDVIKTAPDESPASDVDLPKSQEAKLFSLIATLQVENAKLTAQNDRLVKQRDIETIKARLIEPYARNVFRFLVGYAGVVGTFIALHGFKLGGFTLDPIVLSVLSGSTALSAIGLVGIVVRGLFLSNGQSTPVPANNSPVRQSEP